MNLRETRFDIRGGFGAGGHQSVDGAVQRSCQLGGFRDRLTALFQRLGVLTSQLRTPRTLLGVPDGCDRVVEVLDRSRELVSVASSRPARASATFPAFVPASVVSSSIATLAAMLAPRAVATIATAITFGVIVVVMLEVCMSRPTRGGERQPHEDPNETQT